MLSGLLLPSQVLGGNDVRELYYRLVRRDHVLYVHHRFLLHFYYAETVLLQLLHMTQFELSSLLLRVLDDSRQFLVHHILHSPLQLVVRLVA